MSSVPAGPVPALMDTPAAAVYICQSPAWLREQARLGKIPSVKLGTASRASLRFRKESLDRWIAEHERPVTPDVDGQELVVDKAAPIAELSAPPRRRRGRPRVEA